jgi:hypothetical protein
MKRAVPILLLILITSATFARIAENQFVEWDDYASIAENPQLRPPSWSGVAYYWTNRDQAGGLYIPLTYTYWSALAEIGLRPSIFHVANLVLHISNVLIVFDLLRRIIQQNIAALFGALIFAVHPLQVESVAWAVGGRDVLSGLFSLLAIRSYFLFATKNSSRRHLILAIISLVLAILAKSSAVVVPLICFAMDLWIIRRPIRRVLGSIAVMLLITIPFIIQSRYIQSAYDVTYTPLWTRPFIAADAIAFYLWKLIWPTSLSVIYGRTPTAVVASGIIFRTWIIPVFIAIFLIAFRQRIPTLFAAALIFLIALLPVLGFAQFMMQVHSTVSDHYMYLPMFGVALAIAWLISNFRNAAVYSLCGFAIALLSIQSFRQTGIWHDSIALFSQAVAVNPDSPTTNGDLGQALIHAGRYHDAVDRLAITAAKSPNSEFAHSLLAFALISDGRCEQALPHASTALKLAEIRADSFPVAEHYLLGRALACTGQLFEAEKHLSLAAAHSDDPTLLAELQSVRRRLASPTTAQ